MILKFTLFCQSFEKLLQKPTNIDIHKIKIIAQYLKSYRFDCCFILVNNTLNIHYIKPFQFSLIQILVQID